MADGSRDIRVEQGGSHFHWRQGNCHRQFHGEWGMNRLADRRDELAQALGRCEWGKVSVHVRVVKVDLDQIGTSRGQGLVL